MYYSLSRTAKYKHITIDFESSVNRPISAVGFCDCLEPQVKKEFTGIGPNGSYYNYCVCCRREKK